jgi:hypothetical protein
MDSIGRPVETASQAGYLISHCARNAVEHDVNSTEIWLSHQFALPPICQADKADLFADIHSS